MKYAVFFRNLNLGRPNCPTRQQFETAFLDAGATSAESFLSNGTLVFAAPGQAVARKVLARAAAQLHAVCGLREPAFLRDLPYLAELVATDPFAAVDRAEVYDCYATFLHADATIPENAALHTARRDVEVLRVTGHEALSIARKFGASPGSPNAFMEKLLDLPATTRAWNTVVRLVARHAGGR